MGWELGVGWESVYDEGVIWLKPMLATSDTKLAASDFVTVELAQAAIDVEFKTNSYRCGESGIRGKLV